MDQFRHARMVESFTSDSEAESVSERERWLITPNSSQSFATLPSGIPPGPLTSTEYANSEELFTDSMINDYRRSETGKF